MIHKHKVILKQVYLELSSNESTESAVEGKLFDHNSHPNVESTILIKQSTNSYFLIEQSVNSASRDMYHLDGNRLPRYVRVNSLKMTEEEAIKKFQELGYSYDQTARMGVDDPSNKTFHKDSDLPNVLVFPSGTDFTATDLYQEGAIFLQDKVKHTHTHTRMHTHTHSHMH